MFTFGLIPFLPAPPPPGPVLVHENTFDTNNIATDYTNVGTGVWTVNTSLSRLEAGASPAGHNFIIVNSLNLANLRIEGDVSRSQELGLAFRYQDQNNHNLLVLRDDTATAAGMNVILYKRIAGTYTVLNQQNITWPRGTQKTFAVEVVGTDYDVYIDGVLAFSATDATYSAGSVGIRNQSTTVSYMENFRVYQIN